MALGFQSSRCNSTPNILEVEPAPQETENEITSRQIPDIRYRTYTCRDSSLTRAYLMNEIIQELEQQNSNDRSSKSRSSSKSQSFVRRLVANLERNNSENSVCRADDEFLTKCYKKQELPRETPRKSPQCNVRKNVEEKSRERPQENLQENLQNNTRRNSEIMLRENLREGLRESLQNNAGRNMKENPRVHLRESLRETLEENLRVALRQNHHREDKGRNLPQNPCKNSRSSLHWDFLPQAIDDQCEFSNEAALRDDPWKVQRRDDLRGCDRSSETSKSPSNMSSFGKEQSCATTYRHFESPNVGGLVKINKGTIASNDASAFASKGRESVWGKPACMEAQMGKRIDRKKSLKDMMSSVINWRKSSSSEKHRDSSRSSNKLKSSSKKHEALARIPSIGEVIFCGNQEDYLAQKFERNATIHPVYGGKRSQEAPRIIAKNFIHKSSFTKDDVDRDFGPYASDEDVESLVKPSAIKNMTKRFSRLSEESQI